MKTEPTNSVIVTEAGETLKTVPAELVSGPEWDNAEDEAKYWRELAQSLAREVDNQCMRLENRLEDTEHRYDLLEDHYRLLVQRVEVRLGQRMRDILEWLRRLLRRTA